MYSMLVPNIVASSKPLGGYKSCKVYKHSRCKSLKIFFVREGTAPKMHIDLETKLKYVIFDHDFKMEKNTTWSHLLEKVHLVEKRD